MSDVVVCILATGDSAYFKASALAAQSVLKHTDFDVFLAHGAESAPDIAAGSRVCILPLRHRLQGERSAPFLAKFNALQACIEGSPHPYILALDADAVLVNRISSSAIAAVLEDRELAMVEQPRIVGSHMRRQEFLDHYIRHTNVWFGNTSEIPQLDSFRFYNSGVVIGQREGLRRFLAWAQTQLARKTGDHRVGKHMISDQDYYQYWTNAINPGACTTLPWTWNHCEYWDEAFPRSGARILHFSNFCLRPTRFQLGEMAFLSRRGIGDDDSFIRIYAGARKYILMALSKLRAAAG